MNTQQAKQINLVDFLHRLNFHPAKMVGNQYAYISPLRKENNPSFFVNDKNLWKDFGSNAGGTIIDFVKQLLNTNSISEVLQFIEKENPDFSFSQQRIIAPEKPESKLELIKISPLKNKALLSYLNNRCISDAIAKAYCEEAYYKVNGKSYFSVAFKNNSGGYELRNQCFKNCSSPKDITFIDNYSSAVFVFEGFIDFLSHLQSSGEDSKDFNYLILNSLSNYHKATAFFEKHKMIVLQLDNDEAGKSLVQKIVQLYPNQHVLDASILYKNYKDLNEWLQSDYHIRMRENQSKMIESILSPKSFKQFSNQ